MTDSDPNVILVRQLSRQVIAEEIGAGPIDPDLIAQRLSSSIPLGVRQHGGWDPLALHGLVPDTVNDLANAFDAAGRVRIEKTIRKVIDSFTLLRHRDRPGSTSSDLSVAFQGDPTSEAVAIDPDPMRRARLVKIRRTIATDLLAGLMREHHRTRIDSRFHSYVPPADIAALAEQAKEGADALIKTLESAIDEDVLP